ncbi:MAG: quercetin 2,3-dioxygenase [Acidobacteria bacterium]|nr:MAG: quercetin 2,3-dioxygenase [Acidobacteriota bacterium]
MITIRPAGERGHTNLGWLDSYHTFSFGDYRDPDQMGFRDLRVINEDRVRPGKGFGTHGHRDMEILSIVLEGGLEHKDSLGTGSVIKPGEVQRMTAGTGVTHSEYNHSKTDEVRFLQIWILPEREGLKPGYEQKAFPDAGSRGRLLLVASRDGREGSLTINQDAAVYLGRLGSGQRLVRAIEPGRHAWVQVAAGAVTLGERSLRAGDGASVSGERSLALVGKEDAEVLVFDLK